MVCGVPNKKLVSFGMYAKLAKSTKCKNGIYISVCLYMCTCLCVSISVHVCDVPNIKLVSLAFMPNEQKVKK